MGVLQAVFKFHSLYFFFLQNILEKFNPGARQLISAGKAYLKALHGASAASNLFNEALAKIAVNAQQGGTIDIGEFLSVKKYLFNFIF